MSSRWRRVALWVLLAPCFFLACVSLSVGGSHSNKRNSDPQIRGKQALKAGAAAILLLGPDLVFRRDGVDGKAVVRGGWPFVVAYELEQPGHLRLTITPKRGAAKSYSIPEVGTAPAGSRQEDVIRLSRDLGDAIQEGNLSLRAYVGEAEDQPVPFKTYGLGAGDQAVGSMTVVDVRFSPPEIDVKRGQRADYSYMVRRSFNQVRVQIDRLDDSTGAPTPIFRKDVKPTPGRDQEPKDFWDGRDDKNRKSKGLHRLQVTAWFGPNVEAWNTALSGTMVRVRP
ncbi:MAG TPA: hypothetical protein VLV54_13820 [Thermoanaerobaculia bacterium]|nr:hypothetical protein [Thermoanaerobaculia bacterium]